MPVYNANIRYSDVTAGFVSEARRTLANALQRVEHAVGQLSEAELWWRPRPEMNAVGNLLLHLSGNVRQWIVDSIENRASARQRQAEFDHREPLSKAVVLEGLRQTVAEADGAMETLAGPDLLLAHRRVQAYDTNLLTAIFHSVSHFEGHAQEIIAYTRMLRGDKYQVLWMPQSKEQGA